MAQTKQLHIAKSGEVQLEFADAELLGAYDALALEALADARTLLAMAARFLNAALWHLPFERAPLSRPLSVGGAVLRYDPEHVVDRFSENPDELVRDCLHSVAHCLFHHVFDVRHDEFDTWSLACDIAAELAAIEIGGERFSSKDDPVRLAWAARLRDDARTLTAPALYRVLRHGGPGERLYADYGLSGEELAELRRLFVRDVHDLWAGKRSEQPDEKDAGAKEGLPDLQGASAGAQDELDAAAGGSAADDLQAENAGADASSAARENEDVQAEGEWDKISRQVEAELRAQRAVSGSGDGSMLVNLKAANRRPEDYGAFLKRFATVAEDLRVSDDEFDYVFYTYGLNRYGNMPLVEPLEYAEAKRVREFVVALDTSGSCSGELIRRFVERTYDILRNQTSFGDTLNVHIVQCDKRVRTSTKVTSLRQLEQFSDSFWVSGGGGTDFRPVFDYVDALVEQGEFQDLRGLIYFTDGYGAFPARPPAYDTAFVFVDREGLDVRVPSWAMKVIMED